MSTRPVGWCRPRRTAAACGSTSRSRALGRFVAAKGSIAVDGVSLTVNSVRDDAAGGETVFGVNVIPHTRDATTLGSLVPGQGVNMEVDMLARYVARLSEAG